MDLVKLLGMSLSRYATPDKSIIAYGFCGRHDSCKQNNLPATLYNLIFSLKSFF